MMMMMMKEKLHIEALHIYGLINCVRHEDYNRSKSISRNRNIKYKLIDVARCRASQLYICHDYACDVCETNLI